MIFDTLYKRTKTGAIQFWEISTQNNIVTKRSGQLGTSSPLIHTEPVKGKNIGKKNETTPTAQAESDAQSDWKKKRDEGYKSLKDLGIKTPTKLEETLPQFNTDASGNVKPMLAPNKPWAAGQKKIPYPAQIERKLDGVRTLCTINKTKTNITTTFTSRSGKDYTPVLNLMATKISVAAQADIFPFGITILDGEIYKHGWTLQEVNRAIKKYRPGVTEELQFWVWDVASSDKTQWERTNQAYRYTVEIGAPAQWIQPAIVHSDDEVLKYHNEYVKQGYEGAVLKNQKGTYQSGQRSSFFLKVKMFDDHEFKIIGAKVNDIPLDPNKEYGITDRFLDSFVFTCDSSAGSFDVRPMGSRELKADYATNLKSLIGKELTVKHFGYTEDGIPFLPTGKTVRDYE